MIEKQRRAFFSCFALLFPRLIMNSLLQLNKAFYEDRGMQALGFAGLTVTEFDLGAEYTPSAARRRRRRKRAATGDTGTEATAFVQLMTPVTGS